ncbi:hypothetical protein [Janibacter sp. YB324]|uniref:hypothetical protein n=1 Tax=Janibacter sp. YB324 TaxID=2761047 RepID=UPI00162A40EE|nr:hypothetical protein [Janibacter sp. YB324]QNF93531.1 hypothetical protein H7A72_12270 [Janibacter sp. YB324]
MRTTTTTAITLALAATGFAGWAQAAGSGGSAGPNACEGKGSGCVIVSRADVDGDGRSDSVAQTHWGATAEGGDKITTRVHTADGERLQVVTDTQRRMGRDAFFGAAKIDGEAGYELVTKTDLGAHTAYSQVLTYRDGRLTTLKDPRSRYRWVTDGSVWSSVGYKRTTTSTGAVKVIASEAARPANGGAFRQTLYSAQWKNGDWQRLSLLTRTVSASMAGEWSGWNIPYLPSGI